MSDETYDFQFLGWDYYVTYQKDCDQPVYIKLSESQQQAYEEMESKHWQEKRKLAEKFYKESMV
jgi:hypothetical protein